MFFLRGMQWLILVDQWLGHLGLVLLIGCSVCHKEVHRGPPLNRSTTGAPSSGGHQHLGPPEPGLSISFSRFPPCFSCLGHCFFSRHRAVWPHEPYFFEGTISTVNCTLALEIESSPAASQDGLYDQLMAVDMVVDIHPTAVGVYQ